MLDRIFVLGSQNKMIELSRAGFALEAIFQGILADHPAILGDSTGQAPILVRREQSVADPATGQSRWSLDHLYVDREGVPILVEVKRASDTRLRREVIGQMLDYAANGVAYWSVEAMRTAFLATCEGQNTDPEQVLAGFLNADQTADAFWKAVEANLRSGRIRMVFVADEIPPQLRRIVEFLNEQMRPAEVLAVEIGHYESASGERALVPRVVGVTERAIANKAVGTTPTPMSTEEWLARLADTHGENVAQGARRAMEWHVARGGECGPTASRDALYFKVVGSDRKAAWPLFVRHSTGGKVEIALGYLKNRPAFSSDAARQGILDRLRTLPGAQVSATGKLNGSPSFPASDLLRDHTWDAFVDFATWLVTEAGQGD